MGTFNIPVLLGTSRKGRQSYKAANYVTQQANNFGFNSELIDVRDFLSLSTIPYWEPVKADDKWRITMKNAHGLIIVVPEYNHSFPGELKIVLDKLYDEYHQKPVGICGVSAGPFGGTRVVQSLKPVLIELSMIPIFNSLYFGNIKKLFNQQGEMVDAAYGARAKKMFEEIHSYATKLN